MTALSPPGNTTGRVPRLLDLFCGAGGASYGYHMAGFEILGIDLAPQPNYPFPFEQWDALAALHEMAENGGELELYGRFDVIHASPPCQERCAITRGTNRSKGWGRQHVQLVPPTRDLLQQIGIPYVIEQPTGHGGLIRTDLRLCMDMFRSGPPPWVQRHRDFELSGLAVPQLRHRKHEGYVRGMRHGVYRDGPYVAAYGDGGGKATVSEMRHALGIDWTSERSELTEAIPPAYTRFIGGHLLDSEQKIA